MSEHRLDFIEFAGNLFKYVEQWYLQYICSNYDAMNCDSNDDQRLIMMTSSMHEFWWNFGTYKSPYHLGIWVNI